MAGHYIKETAVLGLNVGYNISIVPEINEKAKQRLLKNCNERR